MSSWRVTALAMALLGLFSGACGNDEVAGQRDAEVGGEVGGDVPPGEAPMESLFTSLVTEVVLEVDYQVGAEPETGTVLAFGDAWDLFIANAEAIFEPHPRTLTVPTRLEEMEALVDIEGETFTSADILAIAERHRDEVSTETRRTFYVVWLDGTFADDSGPRTNVLGVSIGDTGVLAMFKPVIGNGALRAQIEQTTLVHEFGHAVGLVNRGVPLTTHHHDSEHGAHCTNRDCAMYFTVEGTDIVGFVTAHVLSSETVIFGPECLDDLRAAAR